jgi:hypothetical protein
MWLGVLLGEIALEAPGRAPAAFHAPIVSFCVFLSEAPPWAFLVQMWACLGMVLGDHAKKPEKQNLMFYFFVSFLCFIKMFGRHFCLGGVDIFV